ncbi:Uncharacterised protein [Candidatus Gugararchaeum adminiculabundum]|nr:Uncharacterised protein [Candidatus Gugararchaeum adminiculabundum]
MDQRTKDFDSRVSELELSKAHLEDALQDLKKENEELRNLVLKQKIAGAEQLAKINSRLADVSGELSSLGKVLKKDMERIAKMKRKE